MAAAAGARPDRHRRRHRTARRLRAQGRTAVLHARQRARRRGHRHPLRDLFLSARAVEPDSRAGGFRAARGGDGDRRAALAAAGIAVHRGAWTARRVRHAGAAVDGREPPGSSFRLPGPPERRPGVGGVQADLAGADRAHVDPDDGLPVGMGAPVPHRQPAAHSPWHLRRLSGGGGRGADVRPPRIPSRRRRRRTRSSTRPS